MRLTKSKRGIGDKRSMNAYNKYEKVAEGLVPGSHG